MKVLLVVPRYADRISNVAQTTVGPPLGLAYMAAVLEAKGIEVRILDANALALSDPATVEHIAQERPDVVGFTAVTPTADQCGRLADRVRDALPKSLIVMGGIHVTALPDDSMDRYESVDLIVRGEADTRFADILQGFEAGRPFSDFAGVCYREAGAAICTAPSDRLEDLDSLPFPARHLLPMERYVGPDGGRFTTIIGSRGCPGRCAYCSVNQSFGGALRSRSPQLVAAEMTECAERFGSRTFGFIDDTFTTNRDWVIRLCGAINAAGLQRRANWFCLTRVDRVDPDLLCTMRAAGCFKVEFGIESGDQAVLDSLGKGTTTAQVLDAFKWARAAGLQILAFVMLFPPAETEASLSATKNLVFKADPDLLQASFCTPYPGTALAAECASRGIPVSDDWSEYVFLTGPVMDHPRFSRTEMSDWQKRLLRAFYFRPRIAARMISHAISSGSWRGMLISAWSALRSLLKPSDQRRAK